MDRLSIEIQLKEAIRTTDPYWEESASFYFIGSLKKNTGTRYVASLSDVDLLIIPPINSLSDGIVHLKHAANLSRNVNRGDRPYDVFLLSKEIVPYFYSCMSIYSGDYLPRDEDRILGPEIVTNGARLLNIEDNLLGKLYLARTVNSFRKHQNTLPDPDTSNARKVAKSILRELKILTCALCSESRKSFVESDLMQAESFDDVLQIVSHELALDLEVSNVFQHVLDGKNIDDWPQWMEAQEKYVNMLEGLEARLMENLNFRFYDALSRIIQEMLLIRVKDIITTNDEHEQMLKIEDFVNVSISLVSRLALSGLETIRVFRDSTPLKVRQSYDVIAANLYNKPINLESLAAAVILLEYTFLEGIKLAKQYSV